MRIVDVNALKINMEVGKTIYSEKGDILLSKGTLLKEGYIRRLKEKNIPAIFIHDELSKDIDYKDVITLETKVKAIKTIKNIYDSINPLKKDHQNHLINDESYVKIKDVIEIILEEIENNKELSFNMVNLISSDLYTYTHSVNMAILAMMLASERGYSKDSKVKIGIGCLLHDIGKTMIDQEILYKKGPLTTEEFKAMRKHPELGHDMIKDAKSITAISKNIILLHHEKLDGSGYPYQLKGDEIKEHVRIATIADVFDAVTSDRIYSKKLPIYKGLELVSSYAPNLIDEELYHLLSKKIAPYPPGTAVKLSNNYKGLVCDLNKDHPTRPVVKVLYDPKDKALLKEEKLDLMKNLTLFIDEKIEL